MKFEYPNKFMSDNLVFSNDGKVWAYYRLEGFNYEFLGHDEKFGPFNNQLAFLKNNTLDLHFLSVPYPTNIEEILNRTIADMERKNYALKPFGIELMKLTRDFLSKQSELKETSEYYDYIGIQLDVNKNVYPVGNAGLAAIRNIKAFISGLNSPLYQAVGLMPDDILISDIQAYKTQLASIESSISKAFSCKTQPISLAESIYLAEINFSTRVNHSDIKYRHDAQIGENIEGVDEKGKKHKAVRTDKKQYLFLQDVNIDEVSPKELEISRISKDNEIEQVHVEHLIVHDMGDVKFHPGSEWLYQLKTYMPFPVSVSSRANVVPNETTKKRLNNTRLEIKDQRDEAAKGGQRVDMNVDVTESGTVQLENYFTETGFPSYSCSIVFKVVANSKEELNKRVKYLKDELTKIQIQIASPYGEQLTLFKEFIPGGTQFNKDYKMEVEPKVLAGMMFGATTNIGDNRGYYLGETVSTNKPVFIQTDLAAKAFEGLGNIFDGLAMLIAGATGKGKSFAMNLITYLSVLTGSTALLIDPKGDRKNWAEGLPAIPKDFINVWTLGADPRDAGALDPFRTSIDVEEGKQIAMDILAFLGELSLQDHVYSLLGDAVEYASEQADSCCQHVTDYLSSLLEKGQLQPTVQTELERYLNTLTQLKRNKISALFFGEVGQSHASLNHNTPIQVLMVENLTLQSPEEIENKEKKRPIHIISEAILISITAWTKEYMLKNDKAIHKIIGQDEANIIKQNPIGKQLMDTITRQGRSYNTSLIQGAQNATDHKDNVANIGMKFSFGLRKTTEAEEMLDYLNLPVTKENVDTLKKLEKGQCLFQDIYGRSAIIQTNPVFEEIYTAFDTSTASKEEREREKERVYS